MFAFPDQFAGIIAMMPLDAIAYFLLPISN